MHPLNSLAMTTAWLCKPNAQKTSREASLACICIRLQIRLNKHLLKNSNRIGIVQPRRYSFQMLKMLDHYILLVSLVLYSKAAKMSRDCLHLVAGSITYYTLRPLIVCHAIGTTALSTARAIYIMSRKEEMPPPSKPSAHELAVEAEAAHYEKLLHDHLSKLAKPTPNPSRPVSHEIPSEKARKSASFFTVAEVPLNPSRQKHHSFLPRIRIDIHLDVYPPCD
ncbi:uncharacterized protein IWZ02DRAFT_191443 [Phyllosticta citriasiana]|uniref:Uncharacterized protein n=1 Tax=Phyllosticta citriasiana TaxID=595635 RepID=A0ABR1KAH7_9PEZI